MSPTIRRAFCERPSRAVYADSQENIWVGSTLGLTRIDGKSGRVQLLPGKPGPLRRTSPTLVISIVEDRSGYLWFGTYGGGLNRYDPRTREICRLPA